MSWHKATVLVPHGTNTMHSKNEVLILATHKGASKTDANRRTRCPLKYCGICNTVSCSRYVVLRSLPSPPSKNPAPAVCQAVKASALLQPAAVDSTVMAAGRPIEVHPASKRVPQSSLRSVATQAQQRRAGTQPAVR